MTQDIQLQLARELASLRTSVDELKRALMGNGQPGIIKEHDDRITELERWKWGKAGAYSLIGALVGIATQVLVKVVFK